ncbi:hypothetical protein Pmani_031195 [Petrolisthes manimaculis]|uniref:Phosphodiesterase n=1 Tax=Petrolisthes manimaculis TaxID=1843537 RepID=A0AAE1TV50_9EUCA|nr:hypothetical protein Pmani_031195 [Petrolisthes manimaculis]
MEEDVDEGSPGVLNTSSHQHHQQHQHHTSRAPPGNTTAGDQGGHKSTKKASPDNHHRTNNTHENNFENHHRESPTNTQENSDEPGHPSSGVHRETPNNNNNNNNNNNTISTSQTVASGKCQERESTDQSDEGVNQSREKNDSTTTTTTTTMSSPDVIPCPQKVSLSHTNSPVPPPPTATASLASPSDNNTTDSTPLLPSPSSLPLVPNSSSPPVVGNSSPSVPNSSPFALNWSPGDAGSPCAAFVNSFPDTDGPLTTDGVGEGDPAATQKEGGGGDWWVPYPLCSITTDDVQSQSPRSGSPTFPSDLTPPSDRGSNFDLTEVQVQSYLDRHPHVVERWLREHSPLAAFRKVRGRGGGETPSSATPTESNTHLVANYSYASRRNSLTSWLSPKTGKTRKVERLTEPELFMELIRDISTELDIDTLCHKILVNVGHLTHADRASLFLAQGPPSARCLVAKLFDVTVDTVLEEALSNAADREILLPWGVGIVGHVADTKEVINIKDAYQDPRFDSSVDRRTGYRTMSVLCMPVCNYEGEVIGVAEIINKKNGTSEFTKQDVELAVAGMERGAKVVVDDDDDDDDDDDGEEKEEEEGEGDDGEEEEGADGEEEEVFQRYLTFCGIGIQNAQLFDMSVREYKRNQLLLHLARGIFEEQTSLDRLVTKIMTEARELLKCERCSVYLLNQEATQEEENVEKRRRGSNDEAPETLVIRQPQTMTVHMTFELRSRDGECKVSRPSSNQLAASIHARLANFVASSGQTININNVVEWLGGPLEDEGQITNSVLTIPIFNSSRQILGVAQMINKHSSLIFFPINTKTLIPLDNPPPQQQHTFITFLLPVQESGRHFTDQDINTFEAFAIFCGLGIQNTQVYEKACRLMARQQVALECLSYHATASQDQTDRLRTAEIPSAADFDLYNFDFCDSALNDDETCKAVIRMFMDLNLIGPFHIPYEVMCRWLLSVKKNYRPVKYHNWRHAVTVAQTMFAMLKTGKMERFMTDIEMLGLLVACLCHDLDHRGTNNSFQTKTDSPLAILYSTSTMEHHHFDQCVMILSQDSNNIFQSLSAVDYRHVMRLLENAILSTDMAMYFKKKNTFLELSDNGEFDWQSDDKKQLLCGMMMTACDVSAIAKPWEEQHKTAKLVADEFFEQGDLERLQLNQQPVAMMDREKKDELPKMQVGFIEAICLPLYKALSESFPWVKPLYDGCASNREQWKKLAEQVDMGLTWIDHEYIEKPVERNDREVVAKITLNPKPPSSATSPSPPKGEAEQRRGGRLGSALKGGARVLRGAGSGANKRRSVEKRTDRVTDSSSDGQKPARMSPKQEHVSQASVSRQESQDDRVARRATRAEDVLVSYSDSLHVYNIGLSYNYATADRFPASTHPQVTTPCTQKQSHSPVT